MNPPIQWYMLSVTYAYHRLRSSELTCYVDGLPVMTVEVSMPSTDDVSQPGSLIAELSTLCEFSTLCLILISSDLTPDLRQVFPGKLSLSHP